MRAVVYDSYGAPDVLRVEEVADPEPSPGRVVVEVKASSINSWDWDNLIGAWTARMFSPRRPPVRVPGIDVAGVIESVGPEVEGLREGDEVIGDLSGVGFGALAEKVAAKASRLAIKPPNLGWEEAASLPHAGVLGLQGVEQSDVESGTRLLMNGAGGGAGVIVMQLAKKLGAEITAVDRKDKFQLMESLGADHLVDYEETRYTRGKQQYDVIIDVISRQSIFGARRVTAPGGRNFVIGGRARSLLQLGLLGPLLSRFGDKNIGVLRHRPGRESLESLLEVVESGKAQPVVDRVYDLEEIGDAFEYFGSGQYLGKVVVTV